MRKKFVQIAAFLLAMALLPVFPVAAAPADESEMMIRVGLCYESSAMEGANLLNSTGSGYRFGYYDSANQFIELASTSETAISVVKTTNVGYTANPVTQYYNYLASIADTASVAVGCYHLQLPDSYTSYADALTAASAYTGGFVAYVDGIYYARVGNYLTKTAAEAVQMAGASIVGTSSYGVSVVITGTNTILFQYDDKGGGTGLGIQPDQSGGSVDYATWFKGYQYYGGFRFERISGGDLTVVNIVSLEDYIRGILPYEMSSSWPLEALKAQAVCARSYAVTSLNKHSSSHFDICNTTDCQVYRGTGSANATTDRAVAETVGQYVWYNGTVCQAVYFSSDGGATENCENVWNSALPYLRGKFDPYEASVADKIPSYNWTVTYTGKELQARLNSLNSKYDFGEIADLYVSQVTGTDNVYSIVVVDVNGKSQTFSKENARTVLGVRSQRFTISGGNGGGEYSVTGGSTLSNIAEAWVIGGDGSVSQIGTSGVYAITGSGMEQVTAQSGTSAGDRTFVISGTGNGHNVGMSQWGAYAMAQQGYTYQDILKFYYTGVEIY